MRRQTFTQNFMKIEWLVTEKITENSQKLAFLVFFFKNRVKHTSLNQFIQKMKFLDNEEMHHHTKFHEDLMISYRENYWKLSKISIFGVLFKNQVKCTSPNQIGQKRKFLDNEEIHLHTKFHEDLIILTDLIRAWKKYWCKNG